MCVTDGLECVLFLGRILQRCTEMESSKSLTIDSVMEQKDQIELHFLGHKEAAMRDKIILHVIMLNMQIAIF